MLYIQVYICGHIQLIFNTMTQPKIKTRTIYNVIATDHNNGQREHFLRSNELYLLSKILDTNAKVEVCKCKVSEDFYNKLF